MRQVWVFLASFTLITASLALSGALGLPTGGQADAAGKGPSIGPCPKSNSLGGFVAAYNVDATYSNSDDTTTYVFYSLLDEDPTGGVPGLVKFCVYAGEKPESIDVSALGANDAPWKSSAGTDNFAFMRPGGNKTNIPLDGTQTTMGTATFEDTAPATQSILLHIADSDICAAAYPGSGASTCYVWPASVAPCDDSEGDATLAYNAMPYGVINCAKPSYGFEAWSTSEFGDRVGLAPETGRELVSLSVLFHSYACSDSGHWNGANGLCVTTPGATFTHSVTANIYAVDTSSGTPAPGANLATASGTFTFPYRPSGDLINCPEDLLYGLPAGARWFNADAGICQYGISKIITFTFPVGIILPDEVIWSVAYNTSTAGYIPIGLSTCSVTLPTDPGCPYDSLNVGTRTFPNAPYAGTDTDLTEVFRVLTPGTTWDEPLGWSDGTPLAAIVTK